MNNVRPSKIVRTYKEWEGVLQTGRGGKKKIRRDTTLAVSPEGVLEFTYNDSELLATLDTNNVYTFFYEEKRHWYPTYSNIYWLIGKITAYRDSAHYRHHANPVRIHISGRRFNRNAEDRLKTLPFTNGIKFHNGNCLNPEIAQDFKRVLNRTLSLPWLRKTEVLAKVLRVATRMRLLERKVERIGTFEDVNIEDPTAVDAEIILRMGSAMGLSGWRQAREPEVYQAALLRAAENGLADYREWLYKKHGCYEMLPVETKGE